MTHSNHTADPHRPRERVLHALMLLTIALMPTWKAWAFAPKPFTATYVLGFVSITPIILTILWFVLTGMHGLRAALHKPVAAAWGCMWALLVGWAALSQFWAFKRGSWDGVAQNGALTLLLVGAFAMIVLVCPPRPQAVMIALIGALIVSVLIGAAQVTLQKQLGVAWLGELPALNPAKSGVSVVQSGDMRWLRPYGLVPHPNIYAGILLAGLSALIPLLFHVRRRWQTLGLMLFAPTLWMLALSFSRGAWLAFGVAGLIVGVFALRLAYTRQSLIMPLLLIMIVCTAFAVLYRPFLAARVAISGENVEMRSISDRVIYNEIAFDTISRVPLQGVGAGNFPWVAADYLRYRTDYDLEGTNVHNVALMAITELGIVGFVLLGGILTVGILETTRQAWQHPQQHWRSACLAIVIALSVVGVVDHYPYTLAQMFTLWMGMLALGMSDQRGG